MTSRALINKCSPTFLRRLIVRVEASPLGSRLAHGAFWSLSGSLIARALGLLSAILVGRILGKVEFGEFGIIQNTIGMFGVLAGFGMSITANKHVAEFKRTDPQRAGRVLAMSAAVAWFTSGVMAVVLFFTAPWVASSMLVAPHLTPLLRISALLLFLSGINGAQGGALSGFEAFKTGARIGLWTGLLSFPVTLAGAFYFGIIGSVWALVITQGVNCILNYIALRREAAACGVVPSFSGALHEAPLFWRFSLPAVLGGLVGNIASWAASVLVVHQVGGYSEMGAYNAVIRMKSMPEMLVAITLAPIVPVLSEAFAKRDQTAIQRTLVSSSMMALLIIVPISLLQTAAPQLTMMAYGSEYQGHEDIVQWLMLHAVLYALLYTMGSILISTGSMWLAWTLTFLYSAVHLGSAWFLVPRHGATGFAASMVIGYAIANIPGVIMLFRRFPEMMKVLRLGRLAFGTLVLFGCSVVISRELSLGGAVAAGLGVSLLFAALMYILYLRPRHRLAL
jgi:O-antigen/teichoic acid export membrane protein